MGSVMREITSPTNRLVYKINENDEILTITIAINKTNDLKNINVNKGTIICSIEELEDEIKLFNFIKKFFEIIKMTYKINPNTQFNFIINTKEEEQKLTNIANFLNQNNIKCYIVETDEYKKQKQLQTNKVEQNNNGYNIVTPTTTEQNINSNTGINTTTSTSNNSSNIDNNSQLLNNELDTRDVLNNIYYIDEYSKEIYNSNGELIGTLGSIYYIDMNNHLVKNNEVIGTIENIKDMPHAKTSAKKRVLEKPNGYISFLLFSIIISLALVIYIVIKLT